ncbi:MAG: exo-alpha-sialidase, partial [Clostridia bacterium]|nr:exo-alpha-sialidase [Clostridia bacterium]
MTVTESHITALLPPGAGNPRNSEGAFLQLDDGRLAFAYSRYHGVGGNDHAACAICAVYSTDEGASWTDTPEQLVSAADYGQENVMSVSLMRLANGGVIRVNECRRIGWKAPSSSISAFYGTKGAYQFSNAQHVYVQNTENGMVLQDVSDY